MSTPLVSALCTIYKAERFMRGLLEDLEAQSIADRMEIVIVDSASPENERGIVEEFQKRYDNITYLRTPNRENSHAGFNRCIQLARGKYVTMACADDRHHPQAFERMAAVLESRPDIGLAYANSYITRTENETFANHTRTGVYRWIDFDALQLLHGCFIGPQPMWRRDLHERYGLLDESLLNAGDWEFWLRLAEKETFLHIDEFLGLYLLSPTSSGNHNPAQAQREAALVAERYRQREPALIERQRRVRLSIPAVKGAQVLVMRDEASDDSLEMRVAAAKAQGAQGLSVRVVRAHGAVSENALNATVSPATPIALDALRRAVECEAAWVLLCGPDVLLAEGCLDAMLAAADAKPSAGIIVPMSNVAPEGQRIAGCNDASTNGLDAFAKERRGAFAGQVEPVASPGRFCLLLKSEAVRAAGGLTDSGPLSLALEDLVGRVHTTGAGIICAADAYVHRLAGECEETGEPLADLIDTGRKAMEQEDLESAVAAFRAIARQYPDMADGHSALASTLIALGRPNEAVAPLRQAARLAPNDVEIHNRLGVALYTESDLDGAEAAFSIARRSDPASIEACLNLVDLHRVRGHFAQAVAVLRETLERVPDAPELLEAFASLTYQISGPEGTLKSLRVLELANPDNPAIPALRRVLSAQQPVPAPPVAP